LASFIGEGTPTAEALVKNQTSCFGPCEQFATVVVKQDAGSNHV